MRRTEFIPLRHFKVLLLQMTREIIEKVGRTGLARTSKRYQLATQILDLVSQLERELKRNVRLKDSADEKRRLYINLFETGSAPPWLLDIIFHSLTEEQMKLKKREKKGKKVS